MKYMFRYSIYKMILYFCAFITFIISILKISMMSLLKSSLKISAIFFCPEW